jgi:Rhs element Vgr protein
MPTASNNRDLVTYTILSGSSASLTAADELPGVVPVIEIHIDSALNKIPTATLTVADGSVADQDFEVSRSRWLTPGKFIEIKAGYDGDNTTVFKGIVVANSHQIQDSGSLLVVTCKHETVRMTLGKKSRYYTEVMDSDVAEQLLAESGISDYKIITTDVVHEQLLQNQVSDWDFMMTRLDVNGLYYSVNQGKIVIGKAGTDGDSVLALTFGSNIVSLEASIDARTQSTSVLSYAWDQSVQDIEESEGEVSLSAYAGDRSADELAEVMGKAFEMRLSGGMSVQELQKLANAKKIRQLLAKIKGKVKFSGDSAVVPGVYITLSGLGDQFNGKVFVSGVQHEIGEGNWMTEATLGWEEAFFSEKIFPEHPVSSSGQYVATQGLHVGVVTDIVDPAGRGRIRVRLPIVGMAEDGIYARLATLDAGNNRGTFFLPEINDEVIVGFLGDDPNYPVVLGMLHSGANPPPIAPTDENNEKGYVSRSEIKVLFHDGDKRVSIETPGGRKLTLDDTNGLCSLEDAAGNKLVLDESGITLSSAKNLTLEAVSSLSISAPQLTIEADATAELSANGSLSVGSSGITEIKGSMVKIN